MNTAPAIRPAFLFLRRALLSTLALFLTAGVLRAGVVLTGGGLTLVEEGGSIATGNLAATGTAFAKDLLPGFPAHTIAHLNDQTFGNSNSWIGDSVGTFAGVSFGATPVPVYSIAFGRDNTGGFTDRTFGTYTLQYTTVANPSASTPDASWTTIGTLDYQSVGGTNFAFPSRRHRFTFNAVAATGIRLLVPSGGLATGTCIDELEAYSKIIVTTTADSGAGSLRQAILDAATNPDPDTITFAPALSGQTIALASEIAMNMDNVGDVTIDATSLPAGLTLSGGGAHRILSVTKTGATFGSVALKGLTFTGGFTTGAYPTGYGGAIFNSVTMTLTQCTLSGNSATGGGAIENSGGTMTLTQCTFSGNSAGTDGGAVENQGATLTVTHCTLSGNSATRGGAIHSENAALTLTNSIVAGNTAPTGPDINSNSGGSSNINPTGMNLIGNLSRSFLTAGPNVTVAAPLLAPFGDYGGPTKTFALLAGSPALNAAVGSTVTTDQRGFPIVGTPDIGAFEFGGVIMVTTNANSGPGSLRTAIANAAAIPGADIINLDPALTGQTITLVGEIVVNDTAGVTIDTTGLAAGITLDATASGSRIFSVSSGTSLTLNGLTLTGGIGLGATANNRGGAIYNEGTLAVARCTFSGNTADNDGGAITNLATLALTDCTLSGNSATNSGGAVSSGIGSAATFTRCTFSGNVANAFGGGGGAINHASGALSLTLTHCTFTLNANNGGPSSGGGAIRNRGANLTLNYCLLAGNILTGGNGTGPDLNSTVAYTLGGANLIQTAATGGGIATGPAPITTAPSLGALASNGGPTKTHALLTGSAGIDAATGSTATVDQRGLPVLATPDLGAFEFGYSLNVNSVADSGPGSLRVATVYAAFLPGADTITFDLTLSGQTITLASEIAMNMDNVGDVTIDASSLPAGLTLSGGGTSRILSVRKTGTTFGTVTLKSVTLTGGNGAGAFFNGNGGAIYNFGTLTLIQCILSGNSSSFHGGAIYHHGSALTLTQCTLSGNSAPNNGFNGGAIYNLTPLALTQSTLSGNSARSSGGAIYNKNTATLTQCTLFGNSAQSAGGAIVNEGPVLTLTQCTLSGNSANIGGGAIFYYNPLTLTNSIVAGNTAPTGPDINRITGFITANGMNLIGNLSDSFLTAGPNVTVAAPLLAPLGNYGGPTQTMALRPGSPARDAAVGSTVTTDQRGLLIVGTPDVGAYEAGTINSFATWSWETFGSPLTFGSDDENDGAINGLEYATRRDPFAGDNPISPTLAPNGLGGFTFQFRYQKDARDLRYIVQRSSNLALPDGGWVEIYRYDSSTGGIIETGVTGDENAATQFITLTDPTLGSRMFWRLRVEQVP